MDLANARACADRLTTTFMGIAVSAPDGAIYLSPLLRAARRAAETERDQSRDPESRLVAQATLENVERAQAPWRFALDEPTCNRLEAATALRGYVAGQGSVPGAPIDLDLEPILTRYNGPLGGPWHLEGSFDGKDDHRIVRHAAIGEEEIVARAPRLANAIFLAGAHDDVAALMAEVVRLRARIEEILTRPDQS